MVVRFIVFKTHQLTFVCYPSTPLTETKRRLKLMPCTEQDLKFSDNKHLAGPGFYTQEDI